MNIIDDLNSLIPKMNSKQREFAEDYRPEFQMINNKILSPDSKVEIQDSYLIIFLKHISDPNTWIEFKIEKKEIYITVVGFGYSMWQVAKRSRFGIC